MQQNQTTPCSSHLGLYGQLGGEHAQIVRQLGVGGDDYGLSARVKLQGRQFVATSHVEQSSTGAQYVRGPLCDRELG